MGLHGSSWVFMGLHGSSWDFMGLHGISCDIFACFVLFCFVLCFGKKKEMKIISIIFFVKYQEPPTISHMKTVDIMEYQPHNTTPWI